MVSDMLKRIEAEAFDGFASEQIMIRLRSMYGYALECAQSEKPDDVITDIIKYESENSLSTLLSLDDYDALTAERTLSDFSAAAWYFAQSKADSGIPCPSAACLLKGFMHFVDANEKEIAAANGLQMVSETLLDFNYASGNSANRSFRMM